MGKAQGQSLIPPVHFDPCFLQNLSEEEKGDLYFKNISVNPSLSYTLEHFKTKVLIEESEKDQWSAFKSNPFKQLSYSTSQKFFFENSLPPSAQKRFLDFFRFLKKVFSLPGHYTVFSQSNFPISIGTASSASSFCALTQAVYKLAKNRSPIKSLINKMTWEKLAQLSRVGSGSSCRSFFAPFCLWEDSGVRAFTAPWGKLLHQLVVIDPRPKKISSTKAHERVRTSPHFKDRPIRAKKRMQFLMRAFEQRDWRACFKICNEEFLDIHLLFESSRPPFKYQTSVVKKVLSCIQTFWKHDGPLVTMDAGANIHLLYRPDQRDQREKIKTLLSDFTVLSSH